MATIKKQLHSAVTGKFVSKAEAKKNPATTVAVTVNSVKKANNAQLKAIRAAKSDVQFWADKIGNLSGQIVEARVNQRKALAALDAALK